MSKLTEKEMNEMIDTKVREVTDGRIGDIFIGLKYRWDDEKKYEDWNGYVDVMSKVAKEMGFELTKFTKKPFKIVIKQNNNDVGILMITLVFKGDIVHTDAAYNFKA